MKSSFNKRLLAIIVVAVGVFGPATANSIEPGRAELGIDASLAVTAFSSSMRFIGRKPANITELRFPSRARYGVFTSEAIELEFTMNFSSIQQGGNDFTSLEFTFGTGFHPAPKSEGAIGFVIPFLGVRFLNSNSRSATQITLGLEGGVKILSSSGLASRLSGIITHGIENDNFRSATTIGVNFGVSFLTKGRDDWDR